MSSDTARKSGVTYYGDTPCRNCAYWRTLGNYKNLKLWACHYALVNRHSRGCEPGEGCTKRTESYRRRIAFKHDGSTEEITSR
jgi:hypothetical protein